MANQHTYIDEPVDLMSFRPTFSYASISNENPIKSTDSLMLIELSLIRLEKSATFTVDIPQFLPIMRVTP